MKRVLIIAAVSLLLASCTRNGEKIYHVLISTTHGDIKVRLYNETPGHRDNFLALVKEGFYDDILFHRIIDGFMIQTGNPETKGSAGEESDFSRYRYTIPAEIVEGIFHKRGALAAARTGDEVNPYKASSGTQFYIVQGIVHTEETLEQQEVRINNRIRQNLYYRYMAEEKKAADSAGIELSTPQIQEMAALRIHDYFENNPPYRISDLQREIYMTDGGTPQLDMNYTVFGEVVEGFEVIDKIAAEPRDEADRPLSDGVRITRAVIVKK